ncbi:VWA domain-containing protein [Hyphomicrobium methylovorum]|uniref:vWA domain-containing protein n=1 Tax=Hyphomicrobium methylovorum TaxID=84 RepID=UPI0015E69132|nr:VWA domain-containing protein [Hyphomicrobium methylovorum]MBA2124614.1 VWA domain-containing protein [Hyphomicrobium methylovorum]
MFETFFSELRAAKLPVTLKEYLLLLEAVGSGVAGRRVEDFYYLARATLVKDERNLDRFDQVFAHVFKGIEMSSETLETEIPEEWLRRISTLHLSEEDKAKIAELGGWDKIMEELKKRLAEQKERHQGGNKWIGTGGTSPFGAYGYNPAGIRIGQHESRHRRAIKVWDKREFKDLAGTSEVGTRNIKVALRKLRQFARTGAASELDLDGTIRGTAENGYLDIRMRAEKHNTVKLLMFFDVGGSMDDHIKEVEELFSAVRTEFKHLEYFYFHNCLYEGVWQDNSRRWTDKIPTWQVLNTYGADYKVIFIGDASMSPYEISMPGGSVEHMNEEPGALWLSRMLETYKHAIWLNPLNEAHWGWTPSVGMVRRLFNGRMYPLTLDGLDAAMRELMR